MRSSRGFWGAIFILLAVPAAVLAQVLLGSGSAITVHVALAVGSVLVSLSLFDFRVPAWITWIGSAAMGGLAAIFFLQAVSSLVRNDSLYYFANQVLGNWPERLFIDLFLLWIVSLLLFDSWGKTRVFGLVAVGVVVCLEVYSYVLLLLGAPSGAGLLPGSTAFYLLPVAWLLLEGRKKRPEKGS
jgi:hypothetical protein